METPTENSARGWCAYESGYINWDEENLYLSKTGVWSDVFELPEKTDANTNKGGIWRVVFPVLALVGVWLLLRELIPPEKTKIAFVKYLPLIAGTIVLLYRFVPVFRYMQKEAGNSIRVPFTQVQWIHIEGNNATLNFTNADGSADDEHLTRVDAKGVIHLKQLCEALKLDPPELQAPS